MIHAEPDLLRRQIYLTFLSQLIYCRSRYRAVLHSGHIAYTASWRRFVATRATCWIHESNRWRVRDSSAHKASILLKHNIGLVYPTLNHPLKEILLKTIMKSLTVLYINWIRKLLQIRGQSRAIGPRMRTSIYTAWRASFFALPHRMQFCRPTIDIVPVARIQKLRWLIVKSYIALHHIFRCLIEQL